MIAVDRHTGSEATAVAAPAIQQPPTAGRAEDNAAGRWAGVAAEDALLFACCRSEISAEEAHQIQEILASDIDWRYVLKTAVRHGVAPLFGDGLGIAETHADPLQLPAGVCAELAELRLVSGRRNRRLYEALASVTDRFAEDGIEVIGLKDLILALSVYSDEALRPMGDVDLLVRREQYQAAGRCLRELGFTAGPAPFWDKYAAGRHFRRAQDEIWIDLQWMVAEREWDRYGDGTFTYDVEGLWRRSRPAPNGVCGFRAPSTEDMLLHLALHLEGHAYGELILLCDIAELLRTGSSSLDWPRLLELAQAHGAESSLFFALRLTERLLGAGAPQGVLAAIAPRYYPGAVYGPLFGNLSLLHESLDDIGRLNSPPSALVDRLEVVVRRQASRAMRAFAELDALLDSFTGCERGLAALAATRSLRIWPEPTLPAFGRVDIFMLARDGDRMRSTLDSRDFVPEGSAAGEWVKHCAWTSRDPVLADQVVELEIHVQTCAELGQAQIGVTPGKRDAALAAVRARLARRSLDDRTATASVTVHLLSPEELLLTIIVGFATRDAERLFGLCSLLAVGERLIPEIRWESLAELGARRGVESELAQGLSALRLVSSPDVRARIGEGLAALGPPGERQLLAWARYGADDQRLYPSLKDPFLFAFALCSIEGARPTISYLSRSIVGTAGQPPLVPRLVRQPQVLPSAGTSSRQTLPTFTGSRDSRRAPS